MTPNREALAQIRRQVSLAESSLWTRPETTLARQTLRTCLDLLANFDHLPEAAALLGDADTALQHRSGTSRAMCALRYAAVLLADLIKSSAHKAA